MLKYEYIFQKISVSYFTKSSDLIPETRLFLETILKGDSSVVRVPDWPCFLFCHVSMYVYISYFILEPRHLSGAFQLGLEVKHATSDHKLGAIPGRKNFVGPVRN